MFQAFPRAPRLARSVLASILVCSAGLVSASAAQAACVQQTTTKAYASFGDRADYVLAPGGSFESGTASWSLTGASIATGTAPLPAGRSTDRGSLALSAKGKAISPPFCVGIEHPNFRMQARKTSGTWASLLVKLRWIESTGKVNETTVGSFDGSKFTAWAPTPSVMLAQALPMWNSSQSVTAQIVLDPEDAGGNWQIDNVYVDPYRRH